MDWSELRAGASNYDSDGNMIMEGGGLPPGAAARITDSILAEPERGRAEDDEPLRFYRTHEEAEASNRRRGGLPQGYGDADARNGYDPRTGR